MKLKKRLTRFQKEFKKQIRLAVAAAIGFLIAYSWKEYVLTVSLNFIKDFTTVMPGTSKLLSALLITIIGIIFIFISSKLLD